MKKRILCFALAILMTMSLIPITAMAEFSNVVVKTPKTITLTNATAYNEANESITSAYPGDTIKVIATAPTLSGHTFIGWNVQPINLQYTSNANTITFTMPDAAVIIEAEFTDATCNYVYLNMGEFIQGQEIPFDADFIDGYSYYVGYGLGMPDSIDKTDIYNSIYWYDQTASTYNKPGDLFVDGHSYTVCVGVTADKYYSFAEISDMRAYIKNGGSGVINGYSELDETKWLKITKTNITPEQGDYKAINITNGTAYNKKGDVITSAIAGQVVTIKAHDDTGVQTFYAWYDEDFKGDITFTQDTAEETTFVMPDRDVNILAMYDPVNIESVQLELDGFKKDHPSDKMTLTAKNEGYTFVSDSNGVSYELYLDNYGEPNSFPFSGDMYLSGYWLRVEMTAKEGYMFELTGENNTITVNGFIYSDPIIETINDDTTVMYFYINSPQYVQMHYIFVDSGTATWYGKEVTNAPEGAKIYLTPEADTEERIFTNWDIGSSPITLQTDENGTYFIMIADYVSVTAKYRGAIYSIYIDELDIPKAGEKPDYSASLIPDAGYEFDIYENYGMINGIIWTEMQETSSTKLDPETAVFEEGKTYAANFSIKACDGYWFALDENGAYSVTAYVNGAMAIVSMYKDDMKGYISVAIKYTVPKKHNIIVIGGTAYDPRSDAAGAPTEGEGSPITSAYPDTYIKLVADEAKEGYEFAYWIIHEGDIKIAIEELEQETISFIMPNSDVKFEAFFTHLQHETGNYEYDDETHWQECSCGYVNPNSIAEHTLDENNECICGAKFHDFIYYFGDTPISGISILDGECANAPEDPAQENMTFLGWYTFDEQLYDFSIPVTDDVHVYAKFVPVENLTIEAVGEIPYTTDGNVVTIDNENACAVGYLVDGEYVAVLATDNGDGTYSYPVPEGVSEIVIVAIGDSNADGNVDKNDYVSLKRFCFDTMELDSQKMFASDVNKDGVIDKNDYVALKRACFGTMVIAP